MDEIEFSTFISNEGKITFQGKYGPKFKIVEKENRREVYDQTGKLVGIFEKGDEK